MTATLDSLAAPAPAAGADFGHRLIPAGDPLAGEAFDAIYEAKIKPELVKCEALRLRAAGIFFGGVAVAAALVVLEFLVTPVLAGHPALPNFTIVLITLMVVIFVGYIPLAGVGAR